MSWRTSTSLRSSWTDSSSGACTPSWPAPARASIQRSSPSFHAACVMLANAPADANFAQLVSDSKYAARAHEGDVIFKQDALLRHALTPLLASTDDLGVRLQAAAMSSWPIMLDLGNVADRQLFVTTQRGSSDSRLAGVEVLQCRRAPRTRRAACTPSSRRAGAPRPMRRPGRTASAAPARGPRESACPAGPRGTRLRTRPTTGAGAAWCWARTGRA